MNETKPKEVDYVRMKVVETCERMRDHGLHEDALFVQILIFELLKRFENE